MTIGEAFGSSCITVRIDSSGRLAPATSSGRSVTGSGRAKVVTWRRPSRPIPAQSTRLAGSPLTSGVVHTPDAASSSDSSYCEVPDSMPCIACFHSW